MRIMSGSICSSSVSRFVRMAEIGGASGEWNQAKAVRPTVGKLVRSAAMTEVQNRVGSLSSASSESQAKTVWGAACHSLALPLCTADTQAERRVVLPLPADVLTCGNGH